MASSASAPRSGRPRTARYTRQDVWYRKAKEQGLRSRAAFKLDELLRRLPQIRRGSVVVDLGCWPGGWLQILRDVVGPSGFLLGVDVEPVGELGPAIRTLVLDVTDLDAPERIAAELPAPADAVLSDAAPKLSGIRDVDRAGEEELYDAALRIAERVMRPGGGLVVKGFASPECDQFRETLRRRFGKISVVRPEATRRTSKELYLVAGQTPASRR